MASLVTRFSRKSGAEQKQFFFAYFVIIFFSLVVALFPKKVILKRIGMVGVESDFEISERMVEAATQLAKAIRQAVRFSPWKVSCLARAISAKYLLKRRGVKSTLYLGVAKEGTSKVTAHAWLRCGNIVVTGKEEMGRFTVVAFFT